MNSISYSYPVKVYLSEKAAARNLAAELDKVGPNVMLAYGGGPIKKTASSAASCLGKPNTPVEMQQKAMLS